VAIEIVPLAPEHLDAVAAFSAATFQRPRSAAYLRWRYLEPSFQHAYLALRDGRCVATLTAFRRPYAAGGDQLPICDSFDWYCLPELRNSGLGVRLMQRMMKDPDPVIVTGGTQDTRELLPRMGFRSLDEVQRFSLPLRAARAAEALARRGIPRALGRAGFAVARPWMAARRRAAPRGGSAIPVASVGEEALAIDPRPQGRGSMPLWTPEYLRWLGSGFPGMGHYLPLYFAVGEALVGWALLRLYVGAEGCEAALLDVRARAATEDLYTWMVSEAAVRAAGLGAGFLSAGSSCPLVVTALRRNRFLAAGTQPIHFFGGERKGLPEPIVFGANWGDQPLVPYPTSWWSA